MSKRNGGPTPRTRVFLAGIGLAFAALVGVKYWTTQQALARAVTRNDPAGLARHAVLTAAARAGERLVAVGEKGIVLLSDDAGRSWRLASSGQPFTLSAVGFHDSRNGVAVGHQGTLLTTADGGQTWQRVAAVDRRDTDGQLEYAPPLLNVEVAGDGAFLATGAFGDVRQSLDGGRTWTVLPGVHQAGDERHLYGTHRAGGSTWFAGELGTLMVRHGDGPVTPLPSPYNGTFFGVLVDAQGRLLAYGMGGAVHASTDGGMTWEACRIPTDAPVVAGLTARSGETLLADMTGRLFAAAPGPACGFDPLPARYPGQLSGIVQADDTTVVAVGSRGVSAPLKFR